MPLLQQFLVIGATLVVVEYCYEVLLAAAANRLAPWLSRHGRVFNRITGASFVGIGAMVAMTQRN